MAVLKQSGSYQFAEELSILSMQVEGFSHGEVLVITQNFWILHGQLTVEPFYDPRTILDSNAALC